MNSNKSQATYLTHINIASPLHIAQLDNSSPIECAEQCNTTEGCGAFVFYRPDSICYLKGECKEEDVIEAEGNDTYVKGQFSYLNIILCTS